MPEPTKVAIESTVGDQGASERVDPAVIAAIETQVAAIVGSKRLSVAALMALQPDDIVVLETVLGGEVELRLNDIPIAFGELVSVDDHFAVRLTSIATE
jgi:flagellar motor switch protein FliN